MLPVDPLHDAGIIVADDLTGSTEVALVLAENGLGDLALMWGGTEPIPIDHNLVVNLDTRDLPVARARDRIEGLLANRPEVRERLLFKKVDSTARGHLSVELEACLRHRAFDAALVALAAPNDQRYTIDAAHHADDQPIDRTSYARDLASPTAHLPALLTHGTEAACGHVPIAVVREGPQATARAIMESIQNGNRLVVTDCVTAEDLRVVAGAAIDLPQRILPVGSAALFREIVAVRQAKPPRPHPNGSPLAIKAKERNGETLPVLVVCGSLQPRSREQIDQLLKASSLVFEEVDPLPSLDGDPDRDACIGRDIAVHLANGRGVVLATPRAFQWFDPEAATGSRIAEWTGRIVRSALSETRVAGVVAMGGAIATQVIRAFDGRALRVRGRLSPVVPVLELVGGPFEGLTLITKGGGVGADGVLIDAVARLQRDAAAGMSASAAKAGASIRTIKESPRMTPNTDTRPIVGLTIGDPTGVGPEITVKSMSDESLYEECRPLVIGDEGVVRRACKVSGLNADINVIAMPDQGVYAPGTIDVLDLGVFDVEGLEYGKISREAGAAALAYIDKSIDLALEGAIHGVTTAPIHKEAIHLAGCPYPGHTDIFGARTKAETFTSLLAVGDFRVLHATLHCSLAEVASSLTRERVLEIIKLAHTATRDLGIERPRVAVAGLNPHASDGGLFGDEESKLIIPAIEDARAAGIDADGPVPPDSLFMKLRGGAWDVAVAMYHDQGHIPTKMMGWYWDEGKRTWTELRGVAVTVGLPIVRTNPDHGTAFEVAGKGIANPQAMREAIQVAAQLARGRGFI